MVCLPFKFGLPTYLNERFAHRNLLRDTFTAFWLNAFSGLSNQDNATLLISAPAASSGSPVGSDFYEMRRRNGVFEEGEFDYDYGPFGVLIPLTGYEGSGWFHCNVDNN